MQVTVSVTESRLSYYDMASPQEGVGEVSLRDIESVVEVEQVSFASIVGLFCLYSRSLLPL